MSAPPHDLAIIGGGLGGYVTALRAAQAGLRVALIERHDPGGGCLHTGCIPTKTLAAGAGILRRTQATRLPCFTLTSDTNLLSAVNLLRHEVVDHLAKGVRQLIKKKKIDLIHGTEKLLGGHIIGSHAAEFIGQITLAVRLGATAAQLTETIFAHPTLNEAAEGTFDQATHSVLR